MPLGQGFYSQLHFCEVASAKLSSLMSYHGDAPEYTASEGTYDHRGSWNSLFLDHRWTVGMANNRSLHHKSTMRPISSLSLYIPTYVCSGGRQWQPEIQCLECPYLMTLMQEGGTASKGETGRTGPRKLLYMVVRKSDLKSVSNPQ